MGRRPAAAMRDLEKVAGMKDFGRNLPECLVSYDIVPMGETVQAHDDGGGIPGTCPPRS